MVMGGEGGVSRVVWRSFERERCENCVFHPEESTFDVKRDFRVKRKSLSGWDLC